VVTVGDATATAMECTTDFIFLLFYVVFSGALALDLALSSCLSDF
jgi:hypothetical protein